MSTRKADIPYRPLSNISSLLGDSDEPFTMLNIDDVVPWFDQPRRAVSEEKFASLVDSVKAHGILQPLLVRPIKGGKYSIVAGERRWRAACSCGLREVPVAIRDLDDRQARECALIENLQREDLNPIEETEGILQLLVDQLETNREGVISLLNRMSHVVQGETVAAVDIQEQTLRVVDLFNRLGRMTWQSFLKNRMPLLDMPEDVLVAVRNGQLDYSKAKLVTQIKDDDQRIQMLEAAIALSLTFRELGKQVQKILRPYEPAAPPIRLRFEAAAKKLSKAGAWEDPVRAKHLQSLVEQLEALLSETANG
jgi:ParB family transcriptional regulator, chromosome partitioning protein